MKQIGFPHRLCGLLFAVLVTQGSANAMGGGAAPKATDGNAAPPTKMMGGGLSSAGSNMEITYSADGKTALFTSTRPGSVESGTPYNFDVWMARNVDGVWQEPIQLGPNIDPHVGSNINTADWELEPALSDDGNVIYFTRYKAESLGARINSPYRDHMHWTGLSKDGRALIVTSTRPDMASRGGHDEWISYQNAKGEWQEPLNLGDSINTSGEDMCWTFTPDGKMFTGGWGPQGGYNMELRWVAKDDVPLLKNFEPMGPPPNLLASGRAKL